MFEKKEYVCAVWREKSFTRAAEKLYISQPALSAAIGKIEKQIGMPLFERRYSALALTEAGEKYIETAEQILRLEQGFDAVLHEMQGLEYGAISVGGSNYVSAYLIPKIVQRFSQEHPGISVSLVESNSVELGKKLERGEIDLVLDNFTEDSAFACTSLLKEQILLAVPTQFKCNRGLENVRVSPDEIFRGDVDLTQIEPVGIERFQKENFILLKDGNNMYQQAMAVLKGIDVNVSFSMDQLLTSYALAATGNGVCFVTDTLFRHHRFQDEVYLYRIKGSPGRTLCIAANRTRYTTHAMSAFIALTQQMIGKRDG